MAAFSSGKSRFARQRYLVTICALALGITSIGWLLNTWMTAPAAVPLSAEFGQDDRQRRFDTVFRNAVAQMQARQYQDALASWHRALLLDAGVVEVKVNMGFTLFELERYAQARDFFTAALEQNAYQANAYYGLAIASENLGDLEAAMGAMRSYIHLAGSDQDESFIRRARAALWEWESMLAAPAAAAATE